jgi:hypothetical protein
MAKVGGAGGKARWFQPPHCSCPTAAIQPFDAVAAGGWLRFSPTFGRKQLNARNDMAQAGIRRGKLPRAQSLLGSPTISGPHEPLWEGNAFCRCPATARVTWAWEA